MAEDFRLIAFDMDGTLLNSEKRISPVTREAIGRAAQAGKIVILCTGRGLTELTEFTRQLPELRYVNCASGALVYDVREEKRIYSQPLFPEAVLPILKIAEKEGAMPHFLAGRHSIVARADWEHMEDFQMAVYKPMFTRIAEKWEDFYAEYAETPFPVEKLNLYHETPLSRARTRQRILEAGYEVALVDSEQTSLEVSAHGVDKGVGLAALCEYLGIPLSQTIAVGDAMNDVGALKAAGLAVAMGNALEQIRELADVTVADCDHDGCAEAIERFLL
ncbi:MAG: Cof-type HAD-IIB family hydrolase [Eubacteriales bacterium]|nr:Cof-type HAD-IIB family hydrolase [Eubacteriales bacterium]